MNEQAVIEGWRGMFVSMGLATPFSRATTAAVLTGAAAYALKHPRGAFRPDGTMRPHVSLSMAPDATDKHFLLTPLLVGGAVYLFT
tara:strand:- start:760 stop:1017 length:258 start_codon:yes stop_codon:yes gene_type:complete